MNRYKLVEEIIKIANILDDENCYQDANTLTHVAQTIVDETQNDELSNFNNGGNASDYSTDTNYNPQDDDFLVAGPDPKKAFVNAVFEYYPLSAPKVGPKFIADILSKNQDDQKSALMELEHIFGQMPM